MFNNRIHTDHLVSLCHTLRNGHMALLFISLTCLLNACVISEFDELKHNEDIEVSLNVIAGIYSTDDYAYYGDGYFYSLAIFVFDAKTKECEVEVYRPSENVLGNDGPMETYQAEIKLTSGNKIFYAFANYDRIDASYSPSLTSPPTMSDLDNMIITNNSLREGTRIPIIIKKEVTITKDTEKIELPLKRIVARIDLHLFKDKEFGDQKVETYMVHLNNKVFNTYCFKSDMIEEPLHLNAVFGNNYVLEVKPDDFVAHPTNTTGLFYTYQCYIDGEPNLYNNKAPHIQIHARIDGFEYVYTAYIKDDNKQDYNIEQNVIYEVTGILKKKGELSITTRPLPWSVESSEVHYTPQPGDYTFTTLEGFETEALEGIVQWPRPSQQPGAPSGAIENETSYASYNFELTAPPDAVWTATLTNGLEFAFSNEESIAGQTAASKGYARKGKYEIKVGATKPWDGIVRETELYITAKGVELIINPELMPGVRKFPGTDTRILIQQTEYR